MNIILVTGASSGIGREFARELDLVMNRIDEVWLVARRKERMQELAGSLRHKIRILTMDITKEGQLERLQDTLEEHDANVRVLVNAAGYGMMGPFESLSYEDAAGQVRLNCEALTELTARVLPFMRRGARIINMASSAAFLPQVRFSVYAASKAYVLSLSNALGAELAGRRIYVTAVCPGPVKTEFFDIAESKGSTLKIKKLFMISPGKVVRTALKDSLKKKPVSVPGWPMKAFRILAKFLPESFLLKVMQFLYKGK